MNRILGRKPAISGPEVASKAVWGGRARRCHRSVRARSLLRRLCGGYLALGLAWGCEQGSVERPEPSFPPDPLDYSETPVGLHGRLSVEEGRLVDAHGDPIQLRGVSSQWLNYEGTGYATSYAALLWMRDHWNVTLIRAAMGVADGNGRPVLGGYLTQPDSMLFQVETIVEYAERLGMYVIIDWHDHSAQEHVERSKQFFKQMAKQYKDYKNVIYEVYNEPVTREHNGRPPLTWKDDIKPYHEEIVDIIRQQDRRGVVVLGTGNWSQDVDIALRDPVEGDNLMYTLHFYACTHQDWLWDRVEPVLEARLPVFVTEWGATDASGGVSDKTVCVDSAEVWHRLMDKYSLSWAAWKLDDCDEASCLLSPGAPLEGEWDDWTQGHGDYVVRKLRGEAVDSVLTDAGLVDASQDASSEPAAQPDAGREVGVGASARDAAN